MTATFSIAPVESGRQIEEVRKLLLEYWQSRNLSLSVFDFESELAQLPGEYAPPAGRLLAGFVGSEAVGCVALRRIDPVVCEMKRLYLRQEFRGKGFGRLLADFVIREAREIGYRTMRLDTIGPSMQDAVALYRRLGFRNIPAYRNNPLDGAEYMELEL